MLLSKIEQQFSGKIPPKKQNVAGVNAMQCGNKKATKVFLGG